jgi:hypothetical protein
VKRTTVALGILTGLGFQRKSRLIEGAIASGILLAFVLPSLSQEKAGKVAKAYDLHGTVIEMATGHYPAGWAVAPVRQYTIKSADQTYVVADTHHAYRKAPIAFQVGQKVDFRIEGRQIFFPGEAQKEMKFELVAETLNAEPASDDHNRNQNSR